jgi:hypothetical protein
MPGGTAQGPITRDYEMWVARRVVAMHEEPLSDDRASGRCAQCQPDGSCRMLVWARAVIAEQEQLR